MHNTARLALQVTDQTDTTPDHLVNYVTPAQDNNATLNGAVVFRTGTISARPAAATVPAGTFYYATDSHQAFFTTGTTVGVAWLGPMQASPWLACPLSSAVGGSVQARMEGDTVRLKGYVQGTFSSGTFVATIPPVLCPPRTTAVHCTPGAFVDGSGKITMTGPSATGNTRGYFSGATYALT